MVDWRMQGQQMAICSCSWGCPCQFNSPPTNGYCHAGLAAHIDRGQFGPVSLDGLNFVTLYRWPGPVHLGDGEMQSFIEERATPEQRTAIVTILSGRESVPGANQFSVYSSTLSKAYDPVFLPISFQLDIEKRKGHFSVQGVMDGESEPIRNPVTGDEQRVAVSLPAGFEFTLAEFASGTLKTQGGTIQLDLRARHSHLFRMHTTGQGMVRD